MHKLLFFTTVSISSINAMITQKEPVTPAPSSFGTPLKLAAKLPDDFWHPLADVPIGIKYDYNKVPGSRIPDNKGEKFELQAAQYIRSKHIDAIRGFRIDFFLSTPDKKIKTDFDVVTGKRIVECKSSARLSQDACQQIRNHILILKCIRKLLKNYSDFSVQGCEKTGNIKLKAGEYIISSTWVTQFVLKKKRNPIKVWLLTLKELAKKKYALCSPKLNKCAKGRLGKLNKQFPDEIEHILVTT